MYEIHIIDNQRGKEYEISQAVMDNRDIGYLQDVIRRMRPETFTFASIFCDMFLEAMKMMAENRKE